MLKNKKAIWIFRKSKENVSNTIAEIYYTGILESNEIETEYFDESIFQETPKQLIEYVKNNNIDYVFHVARLLTPFDILDELRKYAKVIVLMHDDKWRWESFSNLWIPHSDYILTTERDAEKKYKNAGFDGVIYRRWSFNDLTMKFDFNLGNNFYMSHVGGLHGNRKEMLQKFNDKGTDIKVFNGLKQYTEFAAACAASKYSLSLSMNSLGTVRETKGRWAEIPGFNTVMVTEIGPSLEEYWDSGKEIVTFDTVEEAIDKIKYLDNHEDEYKLMIEKAHERLMKKHLTKIIFKDILKRIDNV